MTYKDNTPTFNVNRKVVNFKDFSANPNAEKEELKKMDRQNKPNTDDQQKNMANSRYKFNHTTRKMDDLSPAEIEDKIDAIEDLEEGVDNDSLYAISEYLSNIKNTLGATDEMYLKLSTRVASQAQSYIIEEVNNAQDNFEYKIAVDRYGTLNKIKTALRAGWEVTNLISTLDMEYVYKNGRFNQNKNALKNLCNQLDVSTPSYSASSTGTTSIPSYTPPKSNSDGSSWWGWIISIVIFIIVIKSCNAANNNNYDNNTLVDTTAVVIDTAAVLADTAAYPIDTLAIIQSEENYSSPYIGNQLSDGSSPLNDCFGSGYYQGNATLTIKNGGNSDAIVCLYSTSKDRTIRNEYVQKNSSFKMSNIPQGYYKIRVFYGNDWNPGLENNCGTKGNFESDVNFSEFDGTEYFEDSSRGYTNATVTLYTVANGNASSSSIDQSSFFNK